MSTVVDLLRNHAAARPSARAFVFLADAPASPSGTGSTVDVLPEPVHYGELDAAARRIAAALTARDAAGKPVLLLYPPGRAYVEGFLGCLYAGAVAVPAYPPDPTRLGRTLPRLRALAADCGARHALSVSALADAVPAFAGDAPELAALEWIGTDALPPADEWRRPDVTGDSLALLQYTSGSTGTPRGVMISHANLLANADLIRAGFGSSPRSVGVSWLPPYHDMGLIGGILQPLCVGFPVVLMSPLAFLRRPLAWLEAVSRYGGDGDGTLSGGPNFAYELCVRKTTPQERARLDLSRWEVAFCGAEPVRAQTLTRFAEAFAPAGFRREAFYPCYGLAEGTLIATGGRRGAAPRLVESGGTTHVGCGQVLGGQRLAVVDPETGVPRPAGTEGEIWLSGRSVAQGYWNRPQETVDTFRAVLRSDAGRHYLRTGDLGLLTPDGELVVTGRQKDLIVVRGRNVYPQDLEQAVEQAVPAVRPGCSAAFGWEHDSAEQVVFACEVRPDAAAEATAAAIREVFADSDDLRPAAVVLLRPGSIPKTSSGKIQRHACRDAFASGQWAPDSPDVVAHWPHQNTVPDITDVESGRLGELTRRVAAVLGVAAVHPDEPLTRLGLDSLQAVEVQHALRAAAVPVSLSELLGGVTVRQVAERPPTAPEPTTGSADVAAETPAGTSPATEGQRALWFVQRWAPDSTAYQINRAARIQAELDVSALDRAFRALVRRHAALRTSFPAVDGVPVRRVAAYDGGPVLAWREAAGLADDELRARIHDDAQRPFDLANGPLFRAVRYSRGPRDHILLLSLHHLVTDFWSLSVLVDDLIALYDAERAGTAAALPPLPPEPAPPAEDEVADRLAYWEQVMAGAPPTLELPTTFPRPKLQSLRGATHDFRLDADTARKLTAFAGSTGSTVFVTLLAAYAALLARYTGGDEVVIGAPTAGRDHPDSAHQVGYFVNPVPLRIPVRPHVSLRELVAEVRQVVLGALDHAVPFPRLVEALRPARDPSRSPLVQTMLVWQRPPVGRPDLAAFAVGDETTPVQFGALAATPYRLAEHGAVFDLSVEFAEVRGELAGVVEYCADLFDAAAARRLAGHLTRLVAAAVADPDAPLDTVGLLDPAERAEVLAMADGGDVPFPSDGATLPELLAKRVAEQPDAPAVVLGPQALTYGQLNARADELAAVLRHRYGIGRDRVVGVHAARCPDAVVAFWAVLKAGGVYLPLDPELPPARLAWLIDDSDAAVVLTHRADADALPEGVPRLCLDEDWAAAATALPPPDIGPDDLAYIIHTSGSTGQPKGVLVPHRGAINVTEAETAVVEMTPADRVVQHASCSYDVHIFEILMAHLRGAALHLVPPEAVAPGPALVRLLREQRITVATLSPSLLAALPDADLPDLTRITAGGELCPAELVARWGPGRRFFNAYGPTEASISATWTLCEPGGGRPPIGRPIPNVRTYVLDAQMEPVPVGVPGELYIGGVGVARGYLKRPELTAARFLPDPFAGRAGARMYRTGDRVRWRPDGQLDFLGRFDDQVKVRGVRIEPGEIEVRLRQLLGLREVAVASRPGPGGVPELVAYLVGDDPRPVAELRGLLRAELPAAMVPAAFVYLDGLPLTPSGKVDRRALPAPALADRGRSGHVAPRTALEQTVAEVWAAALGHATVGVRDHFFDELGGTSLLVAKVASELGRRLACDVPVTHLFEHPTVESLARRLAQRDQEKPDGASAPTLTAPESVAAARRQALARRQRSRTGETRRTQS